MQIFISCKSFPKIWDSVYTWIKHNTGETNDINSYHFKLSVIRTQMALSVAQMWDSTVLGFKPHYKQYWTLVWA